MSDYTKLTALLLRIGLCTGKSYHATERGAKSIKLLYYSLISGPQTFSDFFYIMKVCEETVFCN